MQDKNQGSGLSGTIRKLLCSRPPPTNFILKNQIVIKESTPIVLLLTQESGRRFCFLSTALQK